MKRLVKVFSCLLFCSLWVFLPATVSAQTSPVYRIETSDGNTYMGTLLSENADQVVLRTENVGTIIIRRADIKSMKEIDPARFKDGKYWYENPHATRYLVSTNALGLKQGQGYYQNTWIFFNNVNVGVTDNISVGMGLVPTFLFGTAMVPIWFMPKISLPLQKDNLHLAAGGLFGGILGEDNSRVGMAYGTLTLGDSDSNLSFGMGYGYVDGEWSDTPMFNLSGMLRTSRTLYLVSENYIFSAGGETVGLFSAALRWAPENFAVDFGLVRPTGEGDYIGIPWLGVTLPFGR